MLIPLRICNSLYYLIVFQEKHFGRICLSGHVEKWDVETLAREQYLIKEV